MPADTAGAWNPETDPVVELRHAHVIHKSRTGRLFRPDTVHAVNDVSLSVRRGETLGLVGSPAAGSRPPPASWSACSP